MNRSDYLALDPGYLGDDGCVRLGELPFTLVNVASKILVWIITRWAELLYKTTNHGANMQL